MEPAPWCGTIRPRKTCMWSEPAVAKTQASLSDDPKRLGRPENFEMTVNGVVVAAGAGYIVPILGNMQRMPGLPSEPQAEHMDLVDGEVEGFLGG